MAWVISAVTWIKLLLRWEPPTQPPLRWGCVLLHCLPVALAGTAAAEAPDEIVLPPPGRFLLLQIRQDRIYNGFLTAPGWWALKTGIRPKANPGWPGHPLHFPFSYSIRSKVIPTKGLSFPGKVSILADNFKYPIALRSQVIEFQASVEDQCKKYFRCKNLHCGYSPAYCLTDGILLVLFSLTFGLTLWLVGFANFTFLLVMYFSFDCYIYNFSESFLAFWCSFFRGILLIPSSRTLMS